MIRNMCLILQKGWSKLIRILSMNSLSLANTISCVSHVVDSDMVKESICKMKNSKAAGQSDLVSEMVKTKGEGGIDRTKDVVNRIILGIIPPAEKEFRKGDSLR